MNIHVPQSIEAITECRELMKSSEHIVTGQKNAPICGIIQDGLVGSYILTNTWKESNHDLYNIIDNECNETNQTNETMLDWETFHDCLVTAELDNIYSDVLKRAYRYYPEYIDKIQINNTNGMHEPCESDYMYVRKGKQVCGKLLMSCIFPPDFIYEKKTGTNSEYPIVKIYNGIILPDSGPLCKKTIGITANSIIHILWKEYGHDLCERKLCEIQKITDRFLITHGFSIGISDCLMKNSHLVQEHLTKASIEAKILLHDSTIQDEEDRENQLNEKLNNVTKSCTKIANENISKGDRNTFMITRLSGAKGNSANYSQICMFVGQQNINGKRIAKNLSNNSRCLPHFDYNDASPEARGFIYESYLNGMSFKSTYYAAIGGRVGIIATANGTAETGYIQKRIGWKIEDFITNIDGTVRDANNNIIQYLYGEDGMNPKYLYYNDKCKQPFFINLRNIVDRLNLCAESHKKYIQDKKSSTEDIFRLLNKQEANTILSYIQVGHDKLQTPITKHATFTIRKFVRHQMKFTKIYESQIPLLCKVIYDMFNVSISPYGDAVGLVATNSLGEPATQMTLNVFHHSGQKDKDVTLGVPRLNELLNTTENPSTPMCMIYFNDTYIRHNNKILLELNSLKNNTPETQHKIIDKHIKRITYELIQYIERLPVKCVKLSDLLSKDIEMFYTHENVNTETNTHDTLDIVSPLGLCTRNTYKSEWWGDIYCKMMNVPKFTEYEDGWVLRLTFSDELYRYKLDINTIAELIRNSSDIYTCIVSPLIYNTIDIYVDTHTLKDTAWEMLTSQAQQRGIITQNNIEYFIIRDIIIQDLLDLHISGIPGIRKIYATQNPKTGEWYMETRGTNLKGLMSLNVDTNRIQSNDMKEIYNIWGIEAVRSFLISELGGIISFGDTYVAQRHIDLLIDSMTCTGEITSVRRDGIPRDVGPVSKGLFEKPVDNFAHAAMFTENDHIKTLAASVMLGTTSNVGTGRIHLTKSEKIIF